jgi:truncated hemoglobin YjbI/predicted pyridoxine 5'-phosphate oxidase superfamily flavin-nucleotide-binding protein
MSKFSFRKKRGNKSRKDFQTHENWSRTEIIADVVEKNRTPDDPDTPEDSAIRSKNFALKFALLKNKLKVDANTEQDKSTVTSSQNNQTGSAPDAMYEEQTAPKNPTITPGSHGEHLLQEKWGERDRALNFYDRQVLDYLAPKMQEFIARQEFLFVATADRNGECDCTSKFGKPGFIRVLSKKYLMYPEYRGNGVFANSGNMTENPHIALLLIDFTRDTVGLHVNGKVRIVANDELLQYADKLPADVIEEIHQEGKKCPERWMMIEVEEAYIQCSKHIPLMKKLDKKIDWGTDNVAAKGGDYFQLRNIPLYDRIGGDKAMEVVVDLFYRKVMQDDRVGHFFDDTDMASLRLKQKSFLSMAFGGPYQYSDAELRAVHKPLIEKYGLSDKHFNRFLEIFKETSTELNISANEIQGMMEIMERTRDAVLNR